ncbi:hypothetical protein HMPREF2757_00480 [Brevibacterium sp. HMSC063G07]|nr:hypothetical protein HMPREF2757_00480 [Brevibacterium sp. HMSC063G07]OFS27246.1 hypothetical protein HMPREF3162_02355 [Brevibacterium sp. HMSC07C04]
MAELSRLTRTCVPISEIADRDTASVAGTIRSITRSAHGANPTFDCIVSDDTGEVRVRFLGVREVSGLLPGRPVAVHGKFCLLGGEMVTLSPAYTLLRRVPLSAVR